MPWTLLNQIPWWWSFDFHHTSQLFSFTLPWKDWYASEQFTYNAAKTPHVNLHMIWNPKDDLRCSVKATLYVRVDALIVEATAAKIYNLNA